LKLVQFGYLGAVSYSPSIVTRRWHVTIRVHLADGSNVVVLELPYSTEFRRESRKFASGVRKYKKLMTVVDRLDELQASSVGIEESVAAYGSEREPDAWTSR